MSDEDARVGPGRPPVAHRFKARNPGRPKGARNKLNEQFIAALAADFEAHGARVIERVREDEPGVYLAAVRAALALRDEGASVAAVGGCCPPSLRFRLRQGFGGHGRRMRAGCPRSQGFGVFSCDGAWVAPSTAALRRSPSPADAGADICGCALLRLCGSP